MPSTPTINAAFVKGLIFVVLVVASIFFVVKTVRTVDTECLAIITLFGEVTGVEEREGIHFFRNPFSDFNMMTMSIQQIDIETTAFSNENQDVLCSLNVNYLLKRDNAEMVYRKLGKDPANWDRFIRPVIENAFKELTITYKITELVGKREELRRTAVELVAERLNEQMDGFELRRLELTNMDYGRKYKEQIEERNRTMQQALQAEELLKKEEKMAQIPVIQAEARVKAAEAEAQAMIIKAKAEAEAFKVLAEGVSLHIIFLEAIRKWNGILPFGAPAKEAEE